MSLPNVFKALSDPIRRDILMMLKKKGEMSAGDIASEFDLSNATISYHLSLLKKADLIFENRQRNIYITKSMFPYLRISSFGACNLMKELVKMMSKERRTLLITTFICLCSLLVYISFTAVYPELKTVQQNLYSNMLFVGGIVINVVLNIVLNFKVCKTMGAKFLVKLGKWIMPFTSIFLVIVSIYSTIYPNSSFSNIATIVFVGLLFIVSGNYFPKNHVNKYIGLKFPWLLNDEESWDKTHKLASYTWILAGIIFILQLFVSPLKVVSIPLVIILVGVLPLIYSLMLVYKNKRR